MKKPKPKFHPNAPRRLKQLWKEYPAYYRIAEHLNVNVAEIWKALIQGKQPTNEIVRVKFGLPRKPRKPHTIRNRNTPLQDHQKWWRRLKPTIKDMYIKSLFDTRKDTWKADHSPDVSSIELEGPAFNPYKGA